MTSSVGRLRSSKGLSKVKLAPKWDHGHLFGGLLPVWLTTSFWIPTKPLHLRFMLSKMMRSTKTRNDTASTGKQNGSNSSPEQCWLHITQPTLQKLNELGYEVFPHPPYSPDLLPTNYHFFKHLDNFLQGKCFLNQQKAENAFQEFVEYWSTDFYTREINKLISCWQKCADCNGFYFN